MSSPVQALGPAALVPRPPNTKKRVLSDSEDTEERDLKRVRPQESAGDQSKHREAKEKKKRRKKKRKMSVVQVPDSSDAESPSPAVASKLTVSRIRSCSATSVGPDAAVVAHPATMTHDDTRQPSAGPSSVPEASRQSLSQDRDRRTPTPTTSASMDKGKGRATPETVAQDDSQELSNLQKQVSDKTKLVSQHKDLVSAFQQSLSCQICLDLMHRPYALSPCGHSACYQCLVNWFKAPPPDVPADELLPAWHRKKTCPHCRTVIRDRPVEIWTIKDMVATLVKSGLATGFYNPAPEHAEDRSITDPWADIFRPAQLGVFPGDPYPAPMHQLMGLRDDEDGGIYRCVECNHEIWDGVCSNCGRDYPGHNGSDFDEDDEDDPLWPGEAEIGGGIQALLQHFFQGPPHPRDDVDFLIDESVDRDWDGGGDTEIESDDEDYHPETLVRQRVARRTAARLRGEPTRLSDSEEEEAGYESSFIDDGDAPPAPVAGGNRIARRGRSVDLDGDEAIELPIDESQHDHDGAERHEVGGEDDDDSVIIRPGRRRVPAMFRGGASLISDDEDFLDEDGSDRSRSHDDDSDEGNLADEVAARELEMYGDDGSVPRRDGGGYESHDSEDDFY